MKRGLTIIELVVVLASVGVCAAIVLPLMHSLTHARENGHFSSCQSNLKQIGLGFLQYTQDADDRLPPATLGRAKTPGAARGWVDALMPYIKSTQIFICPAGNASKPRATSYFFNRNLARRALNRLPEPSTLILLGDGNDGDARPDASYSLRALPPSWLEDAASPAQRHGGSAKYLMADGRVLSATPAELAAGAARFEPGLP